MVICGRWLVVCFFFFQAEDGIRDLIVTGVQTCALPIYRRSSPPAVPHQLGAVHAAGGDGRPVPAGEGRCRWQVSLGGRLWSFPAGRQQCHAGGTCREPPDRDLPDSARRPGSPERVALTRKSAPEGRGRSRDCATGASAYWAAYLLENCLTIASASGSAIMCMWL